MNSKDELIDLIKQQTQEDFLVIAEGKQDEKALKELGFQNIITLSKKPLFKVVEQVVAKNKETLILTDLDKEGKLLYGKLNHQLQQFGVKVNNKLRNYLFRHTKLRQIEGLHNYLSRDKHFEKQTSDL